MVLEGPSNIIPCAKMSPVPTSPL